MTVITRGLVMVGAVAVLLMALALMMASCSPEASEQYSNVAMFAIDSETAAAYQRDALSATVALANVQADAALALERERTERLRMWRDVIIGAAIFAVVFVAMVVWLRANWMLTRIAARQALPVDLQAKLIDLETRPVRPALPVPGVRQITKKEGG